MPKKKDLLDKLCRKPSPNNFTTRELDLLMGKCGCEKFSGGRGSGIGFVHNETKRIFQTPNLRLAIKLPPTNGTFLFLID